MTRCPGCGEEIKEMELYKYQGEYYCSRDCGMRERLEQIKSNIKSRNFSESVDAYDIAEFLLECIDYREQEIILSKAIANKLLEKCKLLEGEVR